MKNGVALPIIVIAFIAGLFLPYFHLNGKIEETDSKIIRLIEHVKTNSEKIDNIHSVVELELNSNTRQENVSENLDQEINKQSVVNIESTAEM